MVDITSISRGRPSRAPSVIYLPIFDAVMHTESCYRLSRFHFYFDDAASAESNDFLATSFLTTIFGIIAVYSIIKARHTWLMLIAHTHQVRFRLHNICRFIIMPYLLIYIICFMMIFRRAAYLKMSILKLITASRVIYFMKNANIGQRFILADLI